MGDSVHLKLAGFIGDVHAEDELLEAALQYLESKNVDALFCAGDVVNGPGSIANCCALLRDHNVRVVCGNHDRWLLAGTMRELLRAADPATVPPWAMDYLASLPPTHDFDSRLGRGLLCHGLGTNDMAKVEADDFGYAIEANQDLQSLLRERKYRFVFNGHSHHAMVRHFPGCTIVNAGTLLRFANPGFVMVDFESEQGHMFRFLEPREIVLEQTVPLIRETTD